MTENRKNYSTVEIAKFLDVTYKTVGRWIDSDKLKAFVTPGGHRRVYESDLKKFLEENNMPLPEDMKKSSSRCILIVDDDPKIRSFINKALQKYFREFDVFLASNGYEAGKLISEKQPCLVILDIMLPGVNGFAVCSDIKENNPVIKVLAITAYDTDENKVRILDCGADAYLSKPFELKYLIKEISILLTN